MTRLLTAEQLRFSYGAVRAIDGIDCHVDAGDILGIIGPNGSGKTTLFNCVTGFLRPSGGNIQWLGRSISGWNPARLARSGLVRNFQEARLFRSQTVRGNVRTAQEAVRSLGPKLDDRRVPAQLPDDIDALLTLADMGELADVGSGSLSYGHSRKLGVVMALATRPTLLMLDEPSSGLNEVESQELAEFLRVVHSAGVTLVIIDHDMTFLTPLCTRMMAMDAGRKIVEGMPNVVQRDPDVIRVYLGDRFIGREAEVVEHVAQVEQRLQPSDGRG